MMNAMKAITPYLTNINLHLELLHLDARAFPDEAGGAPHRHVPQVAAVGAARLAQDVHCVIPWLKGIHHRHLHL